MAPGTHEEINVANSGPSGFGAEWNPDRERLVLAKYALAAVAVLGIGAVTVYVGLPGVAAAKDVFDTAKVILPPIVTLILGAYFRSSAD